MIPALALFLSFSAAANDPRLLQAQKFLEARDCVGLEGLFKGVKAQDAGKDLAYARMLVQAANGCRAQDKVLAFTLTEKALAFAPTDYGVQTAHAESLVTTDQRSEGSALLDRVIQEHPDTALRARFLRAQLALEERDYAVALQVSKPLTSDAEYGPKVQPLLDEANKGLQESTGSKERLAQQEEQVRKNSEKAESVASSRSGGKGAQASGYEVWSGKNVRIKNGSRHTFATKGIKAGTSYVFAAIGSCEIQDSKKRTKKKGGKKKAFLIEDQAAQDFSVDFKVSVGSLDPVGLEVDVDEPKHNTFVFRAAEDNPQIRIEDRTVGRVNVKCEISDIGVHNP